MTSQVEKRLSQVKEDSAGALIAYLPLGFPSLSESVEAAVALAEAGVDVLELGIPYSDPVMDGSVIQAATVEALKHGFRVSDGLDAVREITSRTDIPVLVMTYWNPVMQYGVDRFARDLKEAGGAGLITPDLIPDEGSDWIDAAQSHDLDRVFLAAPSSSDERLRQAIHESRGFVYTVSTMGVTGARDDVDQAARELVKRLRGEGCEFACVGLGISTPDQVREVLEYADGAIVGSAFVRALADGGVPQLRKLASELSAATKR